MISLELARALRGAGLRWRPAPGDRFTIDQPELVGEVFTVAEMSIETHRFPTGTVLGFNGTVEWALDAVTLDQTVWLPREDQLRELLGGTFRSLRREDDAFLVTTTVPGRGAAEHRAPGAADAYARALLELIGPATG
ncbi:pilus assembly protein CpaE [Georgenia thermotolerans]|uniref:Pilus assembly protein CpaE n=1 Tax=Georgenia thermotolerans TaxID=527326 RepID=A0A7J5UMV2_9MICO|nr:pilus assembly protein CpaE [Georgenia thermotolerans]KAE8763716.1 pilus assembly protein CpaE [Georgenia thermotolerans]